MPRKSKIEELGPRAEALVSQLSADNKSYRDIADQVTEQFGEDVSHTAVQNYLENRQTERMKEMGAKNFKQLQKKEVEKILDVGSQLKKINKKLHKALDSLDETNKEDMGHLIQLSKRVEQQLKFHKEFMEEVMSPDKVEQNFVKQENTTNISITEVNKHLHKLEKKGVIEIKDPDRLDEIKD